MKYLICKKQHGYGCDYTIGCGMVFYFAEANSVKELEERIIWPDGKNEYNQLEGEQRLVEIIIVPAENAHSVDIEKYRFEIGEQKSKDAKEEKRQAELAELKRLQEKYL